jgi:hypothetical protein
MNGRQEKGCPARFSAEFGAALSLDIRNEELSSDPSAARPFQAAIAAGDHTGVEQINIIFVGNKSLPRRFSPAEGNCGKLNAIEESRNSFIIVDCRDGSRNRFFLLSIIFFRKKIRQVPFS